MERTPEETTRRKTHGLVLLLFVLGVIGSTLYTIYFR